MKWLNDLVDENTRQIEAFASGRLRYGSGRKKDETAQCIAYYREKIAELETLLARGIC